jgi:hypothetical protein
LDVVHAGVALHSWSSPSTVVEKSVIF